MHNVELKIEFDSIEFEKHKIRNNFSIFGLELKKKIEKKTIGQMLFFQF